ncbi:hypothetical protein FXO38_26106 [Capsicum annuum]|nr:hypothetical protein FXO38_26106 [Capsicum annuum]
MDFVPSIQAVKLLSVVVVHQHDDDDHRSLAYQDDDDIDVDTEVDILDMENDGYIGHTTFPKGFLTTVNLLDWNGHLSFAEIVKDELHVLVLQDYKRLKWAQTKQIIRLMPSFLQRIDVTYTAVCVHKYLLFFVRRNKIAGGTSYFCSYHIHTGKLTTRQLHSSEAIVPSQITTRLARRPPI